jgi:glyoxylase-like metal-dependent hydrolase (beta-lactamase superfamily II)
MPILTAITEKITTIKLPISVGIIRLSDVNCFLIGNNSGFVLIDTGISTQRIELEKSLERANCYPGNLRLIILTHGDFDHTGNAAYLGNRFNAPVAIHSSDKQMVETGDMSSNRKNNLFNILIFRHVAYYFHALSFFSQSSRLQHFTPDFTFDEGYSFSRYGFDAEVIHLPGHSLGSIGILTASGDLFCGDLLVNRRKPHLNYLLDDRAAAMASVAKLTGLSIKTVYPAHGDSFTMEKFSL